MLRPSAFNSFLIKNRRKGCFTVECCLDKVNLVRLHFCCYVQRFLQRSSCLSDETTVPLTFYPPSSSLFFHVFPHISTVLLLCLFLRLHLSAKQSLTTFVFLDVSLRTAWCCWTALRTLSDWPRKNIPRKKAERQ